ncbi:MAG: hypothetical protein ACFE0Q_15215 [Anaerolineae bacterium]
MNHKIEGYNTLIYLHQHLSYVMCTFPIVLDDKQIKSIRLLHERSAKLIKVWNDAITETLEGYEVEPELRRRLVYLMTRMIIINEMLSKELDYDMYLYFEDITALLEYVSSTFFKIDPLGDTT